MPDSDLIPKGHTMGPGDAPPLAAVLRLARRRRRVRAGVVGAVAAGGAIVAVVLAVPGPSTGSLKTVTPAVQPTLPSGRQQTPPASGAPATHAPAGANGPATGTAAARQSAAAAASRAASSAAVAGANAGPIVGPPHRMTSYDASRTCDGTGPTAAFGWCSYYTGATSGRAGQPVQLATDVCRLPGQSTGQLVSDNGQQAEFSVAKKAYPSAWTWSHGRRFTSTATSISVAPGQCVEWFVTWRVVDDRGRSLPAGAYDLDATPLVSPPGDNGAAVINPQHFTVTG